MVREPLLCGRSSARRYFCVTSAKRRIPSVPSPDVLSTGHAPGRAGGAHPTPQEPRAAASACWRADPPPPTSAAAGVSRLLCPPWHEWGCFPNAGGRPLRRLFKGPLPLEPPPLPRVDVASAWRSAIVLSRKHLTARRPLGRPPSGVNVRPAAQPEEGPGRPRQAAPPLESPQCSRN